MFKKDFALKMLVAVFAILVISNPAVASEQPEIFAQLGHTKSVPFVAFSPDGKFIVSGSSDQTIKIWDVSTAREIRTIYNAGERISSVAMSPCGRYILSADEEMTDQLKLWDITTGKRVRTFKGHKEKYGSARINAVFSRDGKYVISGGSDRSLKLWDVASGNEIRTFSGHTIDISDVAVSPDGRYVVAGGTNKPEPPSADVDNSAATEKAESNDNCNIGMWEIATGKKVMACYHPGRTLKVALTPDGKYLISANLGNSKAVMWELPTGRQAKVFDTGGTPAVAISPNGEYVLFGGGVGLQLWDIETGKKIKVFKEPSGWTYSVAFSPNGRYAIAGHDSHAPKLWEIEPEKEEASKFEKIGDWLSAKLGDGESVEEIDRPLRIFGGYARAVASASVSAAGDTMVVGKSRMLNVWDLENARLTEIINHTMGIATVAISPDGTYAAAGGYDYTESRPLVRLWNIEEGKEIKTFFKKSKHGMWTRPFAITPDNRNIFWSNGTELLLSDIVTGSQVKTLGGIEYEITDAAISDDGRYASSTDGDGLRIWDLATEKPIKLFKYAKGTIRPDGKTLLFMGLDIVFSKDGDIVNNDKLIFALWDVEKKKTIRRRSVDFKCAIPIGDWGNRIKHIDSVVMSRDGKLALWADKGNMTLHLWDISKGKELKVFSEHTNAITSMGVSPDWNSVYSTSDDGTTRLWNVATGKEIARFVSFTDGEWIVITPEGYYNSSANGDKYLNVRIGNNVYGIDQYRASFYKPRIVAAALKGASIEDAVAVIDGGQRTSLSAVNAEPPFIVIKSPEDNGRIDATVADVALYIEDRNQTIKQVKVFVNGRLLTEGKERGIKVTGTVPQSRKTLELKVPVQLDAGENLIEVTAFNGFSEGRKSIRVYASSRTAGTGILPNLWILAIGINDYQDKQLNSLSYAAQDAEAIVRAFKGQRGKLFRDINALIINDGGKIQPTYENIIDNLNYLSRAGHNDVAMLFIAGHGMNDDRGEFYFLPCDAVIAHDGTIKRSRAISWREIKSILDIPAKKLLFADTCHSEGVSGKKTRGVDSDRFVRELQEANAVIFTSSRGKELSQESDRWKHGAFTYAMVEGLQGKADLIKDNKISMKELDTYVSETVPKITGGAQHPITNTPDGYVNFPVAIVK